MADGAHGAGTWPDWRRGGEGLDGYRALARYVAPEALDGLGLADRTVVERTLRAQASGDPTARRAARVETAERLYEILRSRRFRYRNEPWSVGSSQRVRDPRWVARGGGTCLDLAVLYAAMVLDAELAPVLVVGEDAVDGSEDHAFVLVDPDRGPHAVLPPEGIDSDGVSELDDRSGASLVGGPLLAVDVVGATELLDRSFDDACSRGARLLRMYRSLVVIDVASIQNTDPALGRLPEPRSRPAISQRLPPMPPFVAFASRAPLLEKLRDNHPGNPRRVVLYGDQGTGKSMLAHRLAVEADEGCGWFLTASDEATLITSLSEAYLAEVNQPWPEPFDDADRRGYALLALQILKEAAEPWVLVLDNANCTPHDLRVWLPVPRPGSRQRLIVTTTNVGWASAPGFGEGFELVPALGDDDVTSRLRGDDRLMRLARGRPLLAMSFGRLLDRLDPDGRQARALTDRLPLAFGGEADDEMAGPRALWAVARAEVGEDARRLARALAWLPPDDVPVEAALKPLVPMVDRALGHLAQTGVVMTKGTSLASALVSTHRLYLRAVREHPEDGPAGVAMLGEILATPSTRALLDEQADQGTIDMIARELLGTYADGPAGGPSAQAVRGAARLQELHGQIRLSARSYGAVADRLLAAFGEAPGQPAQGDVGSAPEDYDVLADCLHGRARELFQHHANEPDAQQRAYEDCVLAISIKTQLGQRARRSGDTEAEREAALGAARSDALRGLVMRRQAAWAPEGQTLTRLEEALDIIQRSADVRRELEGKPTAEVARSIYNLGGTWLQLAKNDRPDRVVQHLDAGRAVYQEALDIRNEVYARKRHPHIAACHNGLAVIAYYRAVLVPGLALEDRTHALREATDQARQALEDRQALEGNVDGGDSQKSAALLAKIALARADLVERGVAKATAAGALEEIDQMALAVPAGVGAQP